jgi:hypothetical protein
MRRISRITRSILAQNARRDFERLTMKLELLRQDPFAFFRGTNPLLLDFMPRAHPWFRVPSIDGVHYDELAPMLLNKVQKQQRINAAQLDQNNAQAAKIASLEQQLAGIQTALVNLQSNDQLVAQR